MTSITFDSLAYFEELKEAGVPEKQARVVQAELASQQAKAVQEAIEKQAEANRNEIATKGDVMDVRLEIERVRAEIKDTEVHLIKWQIGIGAVLGSGMLVMAYIMAKGFGWLGF